MLAKTVSIQGGRPYQEDAYTNISINNSIYFSGIFDGHGGGKISEMCSANFPAILRQRINEIPYDISQAINNSFNIIDNLAFHMNVPHIGSTVVYTLVTPDRLWFANAGDSICIVGYTDNTFQLMSQEHKVEYEKKRIEDNGGFITYFDGVARVNGNLNVSRSVGDHYLKQWVICTPFVRSIPNKNIKYIVLASDGVSDVLSPSKINELITTNIDLKDIVELSQNLGSMDNITITLIDGF